MKKMRKLPDRDWTVLYDVLCDMEPRTVKDVMERYNWTHGRALRCLERLTKRGYLKRRIETFWNGRFYANRYWYW